MPILLIPDLAGRRSRGSGDGTPPPLTLVRRRVFAMPTSRPGPPIR